jgi:hypothetical protein
MTDDRPSSLRLYQDETRDRKFNNRSLLAIPYSLLRFYTFDFFTPARRQAGLAFD